MYEFVKYPKTTAEQLTSELPDGLWTVQEKLDGANARIEFYHEASTDFLVVGSKNQAKASISFLGIVVTEDKLVDSYDPIGGLIRQVVASAHAIAAFMLDNSLRAIQGEWLVPHTLKYPEDQYQRFVVFDLVNTDGINLDPENFKVELAALGFFVVETHALSLTNYTRTKDIERGLRAISELAAISGRPRIEGIVLKRYDLDAKAERDQNGDRYCYKHVLPEFKEDHRNNKMFPDPKAALTPEHRLARYLPERSLEKVTVNLKASNGGRFETKLIPAAMGMAWQEFCEEHLVKALQQEKHPIVNTKTLKLEIERLTREFIFSGKVM